MTLAAITAKLSALTQQAGKQRKLVNDLEAPKRKLAEIEAELAATEAAQAQAEADRAQWEAELFDCRRFLDYWEPRAAKLQHAVEVLDDLADAATYGMVRGINQYDIGRAAATCRSHLEYMKTRRTERKRLEAALKEL